MDLSKIRVAAKYSEPVEGLTHSYYRYPARFSPVFAAAVIKRFSKPGQLVLDPYMGGGTSIVEAVAAGRRAIGCDINSLSLFITKVKTTPLVSFQLESVRTWITKTIDDLNYRFPRSELLELLDDERTRNLQVPRGRAIKKVIGVLLASLAKLADADAQDFARSIILRTSQWALDNRKVTTSLEEFRSRFMFFADEMLVTIQRFSELERIQGRASDSCTLIESDAAKIDKASPFRNGRKKVDLVLASPPYPGVHMLYHRWQIDGRRETPAPYWIADCHDGHGTAFYTFGDRRRDNLDFYFETSLKTLEAIRRVTKDGAYMIQMVAFSDPKNHLRRYLTNMTRAGFTEVRSSDLSHRIYRDVPNRKWHANFKGQTSSSREVVLVHRAI